MEALSALSHARFVPARATARLPASVSVVTLERTTRPLPPAAPLPVRTASQLWRSVLWHVLAGDVPLWKRLMDVCGACVLLLVLAPVFLVVAVLIKLHDGGPILFWQTRVGHRGRCFAFPKFRSMVVGAEALQDSLLHQNHHVKPSITFKMKRDPRVTPIGSFIRKYSLDELPQVWCVLLGDMTLVGPRPPLPREVDLYTQQDLRRLEVTPGLTCIWQVSGRGDLPFEDQLALDIEYIEKRGFWLDLKLLLWTVPAVLQGKGAY